MTLNLIELAKAAAQLRNRSSLDALKRLYAIEREYIRRIEQQQEVCFGKEAGSHTAGH